MTLEQISELANIVGVVVIVATLIYLAIQTKQNTDAIQSSVRQAMLSEDVELLQNVIERPFLNNRTNLTPEQEVQVTAQLIAFIRTRESHWLQYRSGVLDEATWLSYRSAMPVSVFNSAFGRKVWQTHQFDEEFVESVNAWIKGIEIQDSEVMFPGTQLV